MPARTAPQRTKETLMVAKKNPPARARKRNSHDAGRSARAFRASVLDANREIEQTEVAGSRGDVAGTIRAAVMAAYHVGRAAVEASYAQRDDLDAASLEDFDKMRSTMSTWGESISAYFAGQDVAANPIAVGDDVVIATSAPPKWWRRGDQTGFRVMQVKSRAKKPYLLDNGEWVMLSNILEARSVARPRRESSSQFQPGRNPRKGRRRTTRR
jgi:hypothetical protein